MVPLSHPLPASHNFWLSDVPEPGAACLPNNHHRERPFSRMYNVTREGVALVPQAPHQFQAQKTTSLLPAITGPSERAVPGLDHPFPPATTNTQHSTLMATSFSALTMLLRDWLLRSSLLVWVKVAPACT